MLSSWDESLSVGVTSIDADHKLLFHLLDDLQGALRDNEDSSVVGSVLNGLVAYTGYHFAREERIMEVCGYPELAQHRGLHEGIRARIATESKAYHANPLEFDSHALAVFIRDWLVGHVLGQDTKIKPYVTANFEAVAAIGGMPLVDLDDIENDAMNEDWQWPI
ncbi:MAG: bacteriohemerythrin [Alphaproteobacteria bacterium]